MDKNWYLLYSKPRQEIAARENLVRQGYETYLPLIRQRGQAESGRVVAVGPMFPRYLFVHLDSQSDNWEAIRSTVGVVSLVRFGEYAARVPIDLVRMLQEREDKMRLQPPSLDEYRTGCRIRVTQGVLADYEGVFLARSGRGRVIVLLEMLGTHTRTVMKIGAIANGR